MKLIFLGAPGAGKGTQAEILSRLCGIPIISTGKILRDAIANGTPIGRRAKEYVDSGKLVPDDVIIGIIGERLTEADCKGGYILDGVPRTIPQAEAIEAGGIEIDCALSFEVEDAVIIDRMAGRRVCKKCSAPFHITAKPPKKEGVCDYCGGEVAARSDDDPETVKTRLKVYHEETEPLLEFYSRRGKLKTAENRPTVEETTAVIRGVLGI
ncbi:MAG: adenylate kinase [Oscillospiraceae bacterium]|nr:adenylate kinase [Oscillospiraceae bacterium]